MSEEHIYTFGAVTASPVERKSLVSCDIRKTTIDWQFSDGSTLSYAREPIDIGSLEFDYKRRTDGKYLYRYTFDNRQVTKILVGGFCYRFGNPILTGPAGWTAASGSWWPSHREPPVRSSKATYVVESEYLPGAIELHIDGEQKIPNDFTLPFSLDDRRNREMAVDIHWVIDAYGTNVAPLVMGPAFKPCPEEMEIRRHIRRLAEDRGLEFLRPLNDPNVDLSQTIGSVVPGTDFEAQIVDCLKVAISVMVPYDPETPVREKARAADQARKLLSARGITTPEQGRSKLRAARTAQRILEMIRNIVDTIHAHHSRRYPSAPFPQPGWAPSVLGQYDAEKLIALTKSKMFVRRWPALAHAIFQDADYS